MGLSCRESPPLLQNFLSSLFSFSFISKLDLLSKNPMLSHLPLWMKSPIFGFDHLSLDQISESDNLSWPITVFELDLQFPVCPCAPIRI